MSSEVADLDGRVVIVTGAARGLGRAHAMAFAAHGARVVVNDLGVERDGTPGTSDAANEVVAEIVANGGVAVANAADVADWDQAGALVHQAIDTYGNLDTLVCNAGFLRDRMLAGMSEDEWDTVTRVHLKGHFAPARHAIEYWRDRAKAGEPVAARVSQHVFGGWSGRINRPRQLCGSQGRDRASHHPAGCGVGALWRICQCGCPRCSHPHDRGHLLQF